MLDVSTVLPAAETAIDSPPTCSIDIEKHCRRYAGANAARSIAQLVTTLALFALSLVAVFYSMPSSFLLGTVCIIIASGLLTKIFIIQHDCGHGSFFNSKKANTWVGRGLSLLTATPYDFWRRAHNIHHATSGDLDRRSIGGIDTITVKEFKSLSEKMQKRYKFYRNPLFLILVGTPIYILFAQRIPVNIPTHFYEDYKTLSSASVFASIMSTNLCLLLFYGALSSIIGITTVLSIALPVLVITSWIGGWLFYVQHQFEDAYWQYNENWCSKDSALMGSSYYKLPKILQWFTGSIGLHHIHHLCPSIPNYKLQECMDARPELETINRLTLLESLKCLQLKLWCEERQKLVTFRDI